jgi:hypothetical protein
MLRFGTAKQKESAAMKCLRIHATPDGESHFDEVELPTTKRSVHPDAVPFEVTASYPASHVRITRIPAGMREVSRHRVPDSVLTVRLDGSVEYETSDGEVRHVPAGSFVLYQRPDELTLRRHVPRHGGRRAAIHDFAACRSEKSWMPTFVSMT